MNSALEEILQKNYEPKSARLIGVKKVGDSIEVAVAFSVKKDYVGLNLLIFTSD